MSNKNIHILEESIARKIAAGEVVERPASVVKELLENAIDASSTMISIEIKDGGKSHISITDNGSGISFVDSKMAFARHATSKMKSLNDLYSISQMGFRGEALYAISAVSKVTLITKTEDEEFGSITKVVGGVIEENHEYGCPKGTVVLVEDIFFNTPARYKFLGSTSAETGAISIIVQKYILSYPSISFKFINNSKLIYFSPGDGDTTNAMRAVYGNTVAENIVCIDTETKNNIRLTGCLGNNSIFYKSRTHQTIFVNNRIVKDNNICRAIESMYSDLLMKGSHPLFVVNIIIDPVLIDVNIHPQKLNVAFSNPTEATATIEELLLPTINAIRKGIKPLFKETTHEVIQVEKELVDTTSSNIEKEHNAKKTESISHIVPFDEADSATNLTPDILDNPQSDKQNLSDKLSSFSYKSKLLLGNEQNIDGLKQVRSSERVVYTQESIQKINTEYTQIGTFLNSYLLVECNENIYIIDQHAAHERIIFDSYMQMYESKSLTTQKLLIESIIDITYDEKLLIEENIEIFESVGYKIEFLSDNQITISEVPYIMGQPQLNVFFNELLSSISETNMDRNSIVKSIITTSCKKAVKAGEHLGHSEISSLLDMVINQDVIPTCPHGRPFIMAITKKQIEKGFGRIL